MRWLVVLSVVGCLLTAGPALAQSAPPTVAVYQTRNGPKTADQLAVELQAAGYPGPWDVQSMLAAYGRASASSPAPDFSAACAQQASTLNEEALIVLGPLFALAFNAADLQSFCMASASRDGARGVACSQSALQQELSLTAAAVAAGATKVPNPQDLYAACISDGRAA